MTCSGGAKKRKAYSTNLPGRVAMIRISVPAITGDGNYARPAATQKIVECFCIKSTSLASRGADREALNDLYVSARKRSCFAKTIRTNDGDGM